MSWWTDQEAESLRNLWSVESRESLLREFPTRSWIGIGTKAGRLNLTRRRYVPWTDEEKDLLRIVYPGFPREEIEKIYTPRAWTTIKTKAFNMGIPRLQITYHIDRMNRCPSLTKDEWIYLAGLMDGDGHFILSQTKYNGRPSGYRPGVGITNSNPLLIEFLSEKLGGFLQKNEIKEREYGYKQRRQLYQFHARGHHIIPFLEQVEPHLVAKRQQAQLLIRYCLLKLFKKRGPITEEETEIYNMMKALNSRGGIVGVR